MESDICGTHLSKKYGQVVERKIWSTSIVERTKRDRQRKYTKIKENDNIIKRKEETYKNGCRKKNITETLNQPFSNKYFFNVCVKVLDWSCS